MSTKVYGADAFTVGADVNLETYDAANWAKNAVTGGGQQKVMAATDDVRVTPVSAPSGSRYIGTTLVEQRIVGDLTLLSAAFSPFPGLRVRSATSEQNGYLAEWDNSTLQQTINLYRVTGGASPVFTLVASGGVVDGSATHTFLGAYLKATATNPVALEAGDNTNGAAVLTYSDSNAARYTSGQPGLSLYNDTALACGIDNIEVWDESIVLTYDRWVLEDGTGYWKTEAAPGNWLLETSGPAPSGYTLTVVTGAFSLSGQAAALRAARKIAAAQASFTLSGNAAGVRAGRKIGATTGSFSLTGSTAALIAARKLEAAQGSFALTGNAAALRRGMTLVAQTGAFALTGVDALIRAARKLAAAPGAFSLTGSSAALRAARVLPAGTGVFTLNGSAARLLVSRRLAAGTGVFVLTGNNAGLLTGVSYTLVAETGAFTLSGKDVALLAARKLIAQPGVFALTGHDAGLVYSGAVVVPIGGVGGGVNPDRRRAKRFEELARELYELELRAAEQEEIAQNDKRESTARRAKVKAVRLRQEAEKKAAELVAAQAAQEAEGEDEEFIILNYLMERLY